MSTFQVVKPQGFKDSNSLKFAVVTVATISHVGLCLALFRSLIACNPDLDCVCFILDTTNASSVHLKLEKDSGELIERMHFVDWFAFASKRLVDARGYFDAFELSCAAKTSAIKYALCKMSYNKVVYLDSDMFCLANLSDLFRKLDSKEILLTPHFLRSPTLDGGPSNDYDLMRSGFINAGFMAVKYTPISLQILDWLEERIMRYGFNAFHVSLFVDQKWLSLLPLYFAAHVEILSDPGLNVGHWNISERVLENIDGVIHALGGPLRLFHFSGFNFKNTHELTTHRYRVPSKGSNMVISDLCCKYAEIAERMTSLVQTLDADFKLPKLSKFERHKNYLCIFEDSYSISLIKQIEELDSPSCGNFISKLKKMTKIMACGLFPILKNEKLTKNH